MRYRELVARISEVTRTLVVQGKGGALGVHPTVFRTGRLLPASVRPGLTLEILKTDAESTHIIAEVDHAAGVVTLKSTGFLVSIRDTPWMIYEPGVSEQDIRKVLFAFPNVIMEGQEGDQIRTYLGTFRITRRKRKRVKDPQGRWTYSEPRIVARIRPGKRLQKDVDEAPSGLSDLTAHDFDEDP